MDVGLLYLLSCLAKFDDMRAELEVAGAVDVLLELLGNRHDTKVQACSHTTSVASPNRCMRCFAADGGSRWALAVPLCVTLPDVIA